MGTEPLINFTKSSGEVFHRRRCMASIRRKSLGFDWEQNRTHWPNTFLTSLARIAMISVLSVAFVLTLLAYCKNLLNVSS